jgi:hypothetical protein
MDGPAFDTIGRSLSGPGSRRRAVLAALGGTLGVLGVRATTAKKKRKSKKAGCPECATCPAPVNTCPQRACCSCLNMGTPVSCQFFPDDGNEGVACQALCTGLGLGFTTVQPEPGLTTVCAEDESCVRALCPVA